MSDAMSLIPKALPPMSLTGGKKPLSCSMSGFADPQAALHQIADYFRQIADIDPQFAAGSGTEPPPSGRSGGQGSGNWRPAASRRDFAPQSDAGSWRG